jgi:imidazolonepropionase-like amidohydrolase
VFKVDPFLRDKLRGKVPDAILDSLGMAESVSRRRNDSDEVEGDARRILEIAMANTKRGHKLGVKIVMGTDSGGPGQLHGACVPREMELIHECGLTPMETITAATRSAAEVIGQSANLGTVEKGKLADIIVLAGDPLRDISNVRKVDLVIRDGVMFDHSRLALTATPEPVP